MSRTGRARCVGAVVLLGAFAVFLQGESLGQPPIEKHIDKTVGITGVDTKLGSRDGIGVDVVHKGSPAEEMDIRPGSFIGKVEAEWMDGTGKKQTFGTKNPSFAMIKDPLKTTRDAGGKMTLTWRKNGIWYACEYDFKAGKAAGAAREAKEP
jgi:hypothetical protein